MLGVLRPLRKDDGGFVCLHVASRVAASCRNDVTTVLSVALSVELLEAF